MFNIKRILRVWGSADLNPSYVSTIHAYWPVFVVYGCFTKVCKCVMLSFKSLFKKRCSMRQCMYIKVNDIYRQLHSDTIMVVVVTMNPPTNELCQRTMVKGPWWAIASTANCVLFSFLLCCLLKSLRSTWYSSPAEARPARRSTLLGGVDWSSSLTLPLCQRQQN